MLPQRTEQQALNASIAIPSKARGVKQLRSDEHDQVQRSRKNGTRVAESQSPGVDGELHR